MANPLEAPFHPASGPVVIQDTILAGNRVGAAPGDCDGPVLAIGFNLVEVSACTVNPSGTVETGLSAALGPLEDNGGPTRTHILQPGSPAIDAGRACASPVDQRGVSRLRGRCDLGALEVGTFPFDFDGDGRADIVVGAGRGGGSRIRVLSGATGAEILALDAYHPAAHGGPGVRVAVCDITGDGFPDIVTVPGAGAIRVRVFDGATGSPLPPPGGDFVAGTPGSRAPGASVACADVNGDGRPDMLVSVPAGPGGETQVLSFSGIDAAPLGLTVAQPGFGGEVFLAP